jgi:hypothetical protein
MYSVAILVSDLPALPDALTRAGVGHDAVHYLWGDEVRLAAGETLGALLEFV